MTDPTWTELRHFLWFLNVQLKDCESSVFCKASYIADTLPGFKKFVVQFMLKMSKVLTMHYVYSIPMECHQDVSCKD